jgi:hypothetical protein
MVAVCALVRERLPHAERPSAIRESTTHPMSLSLKAFRAARGSRVDFQPETPIWQRALGVFSPIGGFHDNAARD